MARDALAADHGGHVARDVGRSAVAVAADRGREAVAASRRSDGQRDDEERGASSGHVPQARTAADRGAGSEMGDFLAPIRAN